MATTDGEYSKTATNLETSPDETHFEDDGSFFFPTEIWIQVFQHLFKSDFLKVRLVCRHWKAISDGSPALMKKLRVLFPDCTTINQNYHPKDFPPATRASIRFSKIEALPDAWWPSLGSKLLYLTLDHCHMALETFMWMLQQTPNLKRLRLLNFTNHRELSEPVATFRLESMEELFLDGYAYSAYLDVFRQIFPRIKVLHVDFEIKYEGEEQRMLEFLCTIQDTLEEFLFCGSSFLLSEISKLERLRLKRVSMWKCTQESLLVEFCRRQSTLESVVLGSGQSISNTALLQLGSSLPNLRSFTVNLLQEVPSFLARMTNLSHLELHFEEHTALDFGQSAIPRLKTFLLRGAKPNASLGELLRASLLLCSITLSYCHFESWTAVFASLDQLEHLHRLDLDRVTVENEENHCHGNFVPLQHLRLAVPTMSGTVTIALFCQFPQLRSLELDGSNIDDGIVLEACRSLSRLERLTLSGCAITDVAASHIIDHRRALRHVLLSDCELVSWNYWRQVHTAFPDGRIPRW